MKLVIGACAGALVYGLGHRVLAGAIWAITAVFTFVNLIWPVGRRVLSAAWAALGYYVGLTVSIMLLAPIHFIVLPLVRIWNRLSGYDTLNLGRSNAPSFWIPCDSDRRKVRWISSLFATEVNPPRRRLGLRLTGLAVLALLAMEGLLQLWHFGRPIMYRVDPVVGYYTAPNQRQQRYGGLVATNKYGMRRPDFPEHKPPGGLRIFMIGDSTLYGGSYIDQEQTYARMLEKSLNSDGAARGRPVEILNMGVNGWGPYQEQGYVEKFGAFGSDIAIICLPYGDIHRGMYGLEAMPYCSDADPPRCALEEVAGHFVWRYRTSRLLKAGYQQRSAQAERGIQGYCRLVQMFRDRGCEVLVEILPSRAAGTTSGVPPEEKQEVERLRGALERMGVAVGFPAGLFADQGRLDDLYHDHCHLHWRGHQVYSDYLRRRISEVSVTYRRWAAGQDLTRNEGVGP